MPNTTTINTEQTQLEQKGPDICEIFEKEFFEFYEKRFLPIRNAPLNTYTQVREVDPAAIKHHLENSESLNLWGFINGARNTDKKFDGTTVELAFDYCVNPETTAVSDSSLDHGVTEWSAVRWGKISRAYAADKPIKVIVNAKLGRFDLPDGTKLWAPLHVEEGHSSFNISVDDGFAYNGKPGPWCMFDLKVDSSHVMSSLSGWRDFYPHQASTTNVFWQDISVEGDFDVISEGLPEGVDDRKYDLSIFGAMRVYLGEVEGFEKLMEISHFRASQLEGRVTLINRLTGNDSCRRYGKAKRFPAWGIKTSQLSCVSNNKWRLSAETTEGHEILVDFIAGIGTRSLDVALVTILNKDTRKRAAVDVTATYSTPDYIDWPLSLTGMNCGGRYLLDKNEADGMVTIQATCSSAGDGFVFAKMLQPRPGETCCISGSSSACRYLHDILVYLRLFVLNDSKESCSVAKAWYTVDRRILELSLSVIGTPRAVMMNNVKVVKQACAYSGFVFRHNLLNSRKKMPPLESKQVLEHIRTVIQQGIMERSSSLSGPVSGYYQWMGDAETNLVRCGFRRNVFREVATFSILFSTSPDAYRNHMESHYYLANPYSSGFVPAWISRPFHEMIVAPGISAGIVLNDRMITQELKTCVPLAGLTIESMADRYKDVVSDFHGLGDWVNSNSKVAVYEDF